MLALFDNSELVEGEQVRSHRQRPLPRGALEWLNDTDRAVVELAEQGTSFRLIARAVNLHHGTVYRRLSQVRKRANRPVVRVLLSADCPVPDTFKKITLLNQLSGRTVTEIARTLGLSEPAVREYVRFTCGLVQGMLRRGAV